MTLFGSHRDRVGLPVATALLGMCLLASLTGCGHIIAPVESTPTPQSTEVTLARRPTPTPKPATPLPTFTVTPSPTPIVHTVARGETLLGIANEFGISVEALQEANGILDPRRLQVGQDLIVPQDDAAQQGNPATPTPTPVPYAIENVGFYSTAVGSMWFLGEVHNTTGQPIEQVRVKVTLDDDGNKVLAESSAFAALDLIAPGGRSPFAVLFASPPDHFAKYQVLALAGVISTHPGTIYRDVAVVRYWGQPQGSILSISGEVKNAGTADAEAVTIIITAYDNGNRVVATRAADLSLNRLHAGEVAPFQVNLLSADGPIVSYAVQVQAHHTG
jgi:LysM repeat protein